MKVIMSGNNVRQSAARSGFSVEWLLVVHIGLFNQQMKNFCEKQHQHRQWWAVFVDVWSLTFFTPFAGPRKGCIFVFLPWSGPQVVNTPLVAACVSTSAEACSLLLVVVVLMLILFFFLLFKIVFKIASLRTWFRVGVSDQNFTDTFLVKRSFFPSRCDRYVQRSALFILLCVTRHGSGT